MPSVLSRRAGRDRKQPMKGRDYFRKWACQLNIETMDPDAIQELPPLDVKHGERKSKLGGRITRDLKRLSPEEVAERRRLSEEFLKQPVEHVPAEEK